MRQSDFVAVALRGVKKIALPGALFLTVAVWLLGTAARDSFGLYKEKNEPYCLEATAAAVSAETAEQLMQTEGGGQDASRNNGNGSQDILSYTLVYTLEAGISAAGYSAAASLTGMNREFLSMDLKEGTMYPEETGMPWLVLNEAALKTFADGNGVSIQDINTVDWLNTGISLTVGEKTVVGKICGVLKTREENEAPALYLSEEAAKELLRQSGREASASALWLRMKNSGAAERVTESLTALGYTVTNGNDLLWREWQYTGERIQNQGLAGLLALLAGLLLISSKIQYDALARREEYARLQELFPSQKNIRKRMNTVRIAAVFAVSLVLGIIVLLVMPILLKVTTG